MALATLEEVIDDLKELLVSLPFSAKTIIKGFSIDTRSLKPGDLFIALPGEHVDGHMYVKTAIDKGASAALVTHVPESCIEYTTFPFICVSDIVSGLINLARGARQRASHTQRVGLTGSVGKTGSKEALLHVLSAQGLTHASIASFNNHWGAPLSLARMPRQAQFGVFEMGMNHAGELTPLTELIKPHVALITRIGEAHKGFFASPKAVAEAKAEIFKGLEKGGVAVLNRDDPFFEFLSQKAREEGVHNIISFGEHLDSTVRLVAADLKEEESIIEVICKGTRVKGTIAYPGKHWISNALGVLAVTYALGLEMEECIERLRTLPPLPGRGQRIVKEWKGGRITFLDETYNANPTSMCAALDLLSQQQTARRRIAVLGDMRELGETEVEDHIYLAEKISPLSIDAIFCCGPLMKHLDEVLPRDKRAGWAGTVSEIIPYLESFVQEGDLIMIKGSRGMKLEKIMQHVP